MISTFMVTAMNKILTIRPSDAQRAALERFRLSRGLKSLNEAALRLIDDAESAARSKPQ